MDSALNWTTCTQLFNLNNLIWMKYTTVREKAKGMKKTWAEIKCDAKNTVRWRIFVDALCSAAE
jgi:hypothetical protein